MKSRVVLSGLNPEMWTSNHEALIDMFISNTSQLLLLVYVDEQSGLVVCNTLPAFQLEEVAYFVRNENAEITHGNFIHIVQFGTMHGSNVDGMLRAMHNLYAPTFFENDSWPDSILTEYYASI